MAKQPYIPLYTGDYLKDTRVLPLEARGAWVDLMVFMWDSKERGVLTGTMEEYAMLMSCTVIQANFAIGLLQQKGVCDFEIMPNGLIKLISRRMVREIQLSKTRSESGKKGVAAKFAKAKGKAIAEPKQQANSDNDSDNDNGSEKENKDLSSVIEEKLLELDEIYLDGQRMKWPHINFDFEVNTFREKVRGSPGHYKDHEDGGIRLAFQSQLRKAKSITNGSNKKQQHTSKLAASVVQTYSNVFKGRGNGQGSGPPA